MRLKIGELAKRSGLSIRTLHHYDAIGLLQPSERTAGGARLYGPDDFRRLHRIQVFKGLGYRLEDIGHALDDAGADALAIIERQAEVLDAQAERAQALSASLKYLSTRLRSGATADAADWLDLLEMMTLYDQHLTADEVQSLRSPRSGSAASLEAQRHELVSAVSACMQRGVSPRRAEARALAWRWVHMVIALTSNNPALERKLRSLHERDGRAQDIVGIGPGLLRWIDEAIVHARVHLFGRYMSPKQQAKLRRLQLAHHAEWPALVAQIRAEMAAGTPCDAPPMQALAARWRQLYVDSYCGGDPALEVCVRRALAHEPLLSLGIGIDDDFIRTLRASGAVASTPDPLAN